MPVKPALAFLALWLASAPVVAAGPAVGAGVLNCDLYVDTEPPGYSTNCPDAIVNKKIVLALLACTVTVATVPPEASLDCPHDPLEP